MFTIEKMNYTTTTNGYGHFLATGESGKLGQIDPEIYEQQCAALEHNEQAAKRRAYQNEYWRQRTLARQFQSQPATHMNSDAKILLVEDSSLEAMDTKHRIGEMLNIFMDEYNRLRPPRRFFDWVSSMTSTAKTNIIQTVLEAKGYKDAVSPAWVRTFNRGIRHMNASERSSYRIQIKNGLLYQNGTRFDTSKMKTQFSGSGAAIFVQGADGTFYSSSHLGGRLRQSSSTSDGLCRSAGEWIVKNGRIDWISGDSEFYKPTAEQMANAVSDLTLANAIDQTTTRVWDGQKSMINDHPCPAGLQHAQPETEL